MFSVVLVSLFGLMAAAPMDPISKGCCMPHQFSVTMLELGAELAANSTNPQITDSYYVMDYDYDMKMSRLQMHVRDQNTGMMSSQDVFVDYNNSRVFAVIMGKCYASPNMAPMNAPCIADSATYTGSHVIGTGTNMVQIEGWMMMEMGMMVNIQVQPETCTPVTMTQYGSLPNGSKELRTFLFTDVKKGVFSMTNPFVLPDSCKVAMQGAVGK